MKIQTLSLLVAATEMDGRMPTKRDTVVEARTVRKAYGLRPVLRDVSFTVATGQCVAVLGPNGAGKTTLLRLLATLTRPARGSISVAGYDVVQDANEVRRIVGFVGHTPLLYDELTARENLLFFARMYGVPDGESRADALLRRVGMRTRANERVATFSRGQAQRVALARGILHNPLVLLLDEPDTGLDEEAIGLLRELIVERVASGLTTLMTTHTLDRGLAWSDSVVVLSGGRIVHAGPSDAMTVVGLRALYANASRSAR